MHEPGLHIWSDATVALELPGYRFVKSPINLARQPSSTSLEILQNMERETSCEPLYSCISPNPSGANPSLTSHHIQTYLSRKHHKCHTSKEQDVRGSSGPIQGLIPGDSRGPLTGPQELLGQLNCLIEPSTAGARTKKWLWTLHRWTIEAQS